MKSPWILGNIKLDLTFFVFPSFITILFSLLFLKEHTIHIFLLLITFHLIDSGHIYFTFFRTYANKDERQSSSLYIYTPLIIFSIFFLWIFTNTPFVWHFVVYATLYHNVRQFYGITRWYQKLQKNFSPWPTRFLYLLCLTPVIIYHFRTNIITGIYSQKDIFHFPSEFLLNISLVFYISILISWILYETFQIKKNIFSLGRFLSLLTPISAYGFGLILGQNYFQILGPIIAAHGIAYMALVAFSLEKIQPEKYKTFKRTLLLLLGVAIIFGILEAYTEDTLSPLMDGMTYETKVHLPLSLFAAAYLTPLFTHYFFDSLIWKSKHREAHLIYN